MKNLIVCLPALALAVVLSGSALAEEGSISSTTLNEMGLSGIETMSDADAMSVRGQGFALASGRSSSMINIGFGPLNFSTQSTDSYAADGDYMAAGSHSSESLFEFTFSNSTDVSGLGTVTKTFSLSIGIGSAGSASSFAL